MYAHVDFPACRHVRICWVHCGWNTLCLSIWPYCFLVQLPMFPVKSPPLKHYTSIYFNSSRVILLETSWDFNPQMVFPWLSWHLGPPDDFFQNMAPHSRPTAPGPVLQIAESHHRLRQQLCRFLHAARIMASLWRQSGTRVESSGDGFSSIKKNTMKNYDNICILYSLTILLIWTYWTVYLIESIHKSLSLSFFALFLLQVGNRSSIQVRVYACMDAFMCICVQYVIYIYIQSK
jgi:hypothetical protein